MRSERAPAHPSALGPASPRAQSPAVREVPLRWPSPADPTKASAPAVETAGPAGAVMRQLHAEPAAPRAVQHLPVRQRAIERGQQETPRPSWWPKSAANRDVSTDTRRSTRTAPVARSPTSRRGQQRRRSYCRDPDTRSARSGPQQSARRRGSRPLEDPNAVRPAMKRPPAEVQAAPSTPRRSWA